MIYYIRKTEIQTQRISFFFPTTSEYYLKENERFFLWKWIIYPDSFTIFYSNMKLSKRKLYVKIHEERGERYLLSKLNFLKLVCNKNPLFKHRFLYYEISLYNIIYIQFTHPFYDCGSLFQLHDLLSSTIYKMINLTCNFLSLWIVILCFPYLLSVLSQTLSIYCPFSSVSLCVLVDSWPWLWWND